MELKPNRHYDRKGTPVIFLQPGEDFPSFGYPREKCAHPSIYATYAEWDGPLGHGWFCALCGELLQVG